MTAITLISAVVLTLVAFTAADHDPLVPFPIWAGGRICTRICPVGWRCQLTFWAGIRRERCIPFGIGIGIKPGRCPWIRPWWPRGRFGRGRFRGGRWRRRFCWRRRRRFCFRDRDCPGVLKCCRDRCGRRRCQFPRWR